MAAKTVTRKFAKEKETKNKVRYAEEGTEEAVGTLYLTKAIVKELGDPEKLTLEISA